MKTAETVCYEIFRRIMRDARDCRGDSLLIVAAQSVVDLPHGDEAAYLADMERLIGKTISLRVQSGYRQEQFDIRQL